LSIVIALASLVILIVLNWFGVTRKAAYFTVGIVLWIAQVLF
jgi:Na+/H+ antiporter NhaA